MCFSPHSPSILSEAESIINGPRREAYGPAELSFERQASLYSIILSKKLREPITAHEVALLGVAWKLSREINQHSRDNLVDLCGYAALADKVAPKETLKETSV